jgi:MFS family permease
VRIGRQSVPPLVSSRCCPDRNLLGARLLDDQLHTPDPSDGAPPLPAGEPPPGPGGDASSPSTSGGDRGGRPRGFRGQFASTWAAAFRLLHAHVELAKAELSEILDKAKRVAALLAVALALVLLGAVVATVGTSLFVGEWLFGSIGWGVLLVTELALVGALGAILIAVDVPVDRLLRRLLQAILIGVVVAVIAGPHLPNRAWQALGAAVVPGLDQAYRPLVVGLAAGAALGGVFGLLAGLRMSRGGTAGGRAGMAIGLAILGALAGAAVGAFSAISFRWRVGIALGLVTAIGGWAGLAGLEGYRGGIDPQAFMRKFYPSVTIETTKETIKWVRERTPLGPKS